MSNLLSQLKCKPCSGNTPKLSLDEIQKKLSLNINDDVEKASANEVKSQTGYSIGGVPPVAHINSPTQIFIDLNLNRFAKIYAAAGYPYCVFGITFKQICEITNGKVIDFVE